MKLPAAALALLPAAAPGQDVLRFVLGDEVVAVSSPDVVARPDNATGPGVLHPQLAPFFAAELSQLTGENIGETLVVELCGHNGAGDPRSVRSSMPSHRSLNTRLDAKTTLRSSGAPRGINERSPRRTATSRSRSLIFSAQFVLADWARFS